MRNLECYFRDVGKLENPVKNPQREDNTSPVLKNLSQDLSESLTNIDKNIPYQYTYSVCHTCAKVSLGNVKSSHHKCYKESNLDKPKPNDTHKSS